MSFRLELRRLNPVQAIANVSARIANQAIAAQTVHDCMNFPVSIQIFENCLEHQLFAKAIELFLKPIWAFGWASKPDDEFRYWHSHFTHSQSPLDAIDQLKAQNNGLILSIWQHLNNDGPLSKFELQACFASAHTFGCGSQFHTDGRPDLHDATAVLYVHPLWNPEWGGELVFEKLPNDPFQMSILPLPNRMVLQPPDVRHAVRSPSRDCPALRVSLVFRLKRKH